jgi:hypothetical protein
LSVREPPLTSHQACALSLSLSLCYVYCRHFEFDSGSGTFVQVGDKKTCNGLSISAGLGTAVAISDDGRTLLRQTQRARDTGRRRAKRQGQRGEVRRCGSCMEGCNKGVFVSFFAFCVAVGAPNDSPSGSVCLFWRTGAAATAAWMQLGKKVTTDNPIGNQGASVALSADATTIAFGSQSHRRAHGFTAQEQ